MRKCLRCETNMIEGLVINSNSGHYLEVKEKGIFKSSLGKIKCSVCPRCGYIETYIDNIESICALVKE